MSKVTLQDVTAGYASAARINANKDVIEEAFDNTLSRDGTAPNAMQADLDMNGHRVTNNQAPVNDNDLVRLIDLQNASTDIGSAAASLVTLADGDGNYDATNVEGALAELIEDKEAGLLVYYPQTTLEATATVTPTAFQYEEGDPRRYGTVDLTGASDSSTALNAAIAVNAVIKLPQGTIRWDTKPTMGTQTELTILGAGIGRTKLWTKNQFGFTFAVADAAPLEAFRIEGVEVDGSNGGGVIGSYSSSWDGFINVTKTTGNGFRLFSADKCRFSNTAVAGGALLKLGTTYASTFEECQLFGAINGYGFRAGGSGFTSTTVSFTKCYFQRCRQIYEITAGLTDCNFDDNCIFESSTVVGHAAQCKVTMNEPYFENIGSDPASQTRGGITKMSGAITYSNTLDSTDIDAAMTQQYGALVVNNPRFSALASNCTAYFQAIGLGSGIGADGSIVINGGSNNEDTKPLFRAELESERSNCVFVVNDGLWSVLAVDSVMRVYSDARKVTFGYWVAPFPSTTRRVVQIFRGKFTYGAGLEASYSAGLADAPSGGQNEVGDKVMFTAPAAAGFIGAVCTTAGSPGTWKTFGAISA